MTEPDTAPCDKCKSEITVEAKRCPECGYEPATEGSGLLRLLWVLIGIGLTCFGALVLILTPILVIASGLALDTAFWVGMFFGVMFIIGAGMLYITYYASQRMPTDGATA